MVERMRNPAGAARKMEQQIRPHEPPAQARPPAHRRIRVGDVDDALIEQVSDLALKRRL